MDVATKLARQIFEKAHPGRRWDFAFAEPGTDESANLDHATDAERDHYLSLAHKQILEEAFKEDDNA
ncbi:hypothetical protein ABIE41_000113 [Bosea sp. OAE506]|uniref:hypothetical protein n=1 Tax=Bosea sp. OAE506 TaxID=2663870 RepID=UPI00178A992D